MHRPSTRLMVAMSLSLTLLAGCAAPLATVPGPTTATVPGLPAPAIGAPGPVPAATPQPVPWTTIEGQATFRGEPLGQARMRVVNALSDEPATVDHDAVTDAEGRFQVRVAGLAPGQAVRVVVEAGANGLSALVTGGQAQSSGYRLLGASGLVLSEVSSLKAQLSLGAVGITQLVKPELGDPALKKFLGGVDASQEAIAKLLKNNPSLANELVATIDPKTGGMKKTKEQQALDLQLQRFTQELQQLLQQNLAKQEQLEAQKLKKGDDALKQVQEAAKQQAAAGQLTKEQLAQLFLMASQQLGSLDPALTPAALQKLAQEGKLGGGDLAGVFGHLDPGGLGSIGSQPPDDKGAKDAEAEAGRSAADEQAAQERAADLMAQMQAMMASMTDLMKQLMEAQRQSQEALLRDQTSKDQQEKKKQYDAQSKLIKPYQDGPANAIVASSGAGSTIQALNQQLVTEVVTQIKDANNLSPALKDHSLEAPPVVPFVGTPVSLHLSVTDGAIVITSPSGSLGFQAGQFGYVPNVNQGPVVVPPSLGLVFTPPPSFSSGSSGPVATPAPATLSWTVTAQDPTAAAGGDVITTIATNDKPVAIADDGVHAWVPLKDFKKVLCMAVDPTSNADVKAYPLDGVPVGVVTSGGKAYVACADGKITVLDASGVKSTLDAGTSLTGIAMSNGELILATTDQRLLQWSIANGLAAQQPLAGATVNALRPDGLAALSDGRLLTATATAAVAPDPAALTLPTWLTKADSNWGDVVAGKTVGDVDDRLFAIDKTAGNVRFGILGDGVLTLNPTALDGGTAVSLGFDDRDSQVKRLFVSDSAGAQVRMFIETAVTPFGAPTLLPLGTGLVPGPLLVSSSGSIWVLCPTNGKILKLKAYPVSA